MEAPEVPEPPLAPEVAEVPESPKSLAPNDKQNSNIIIRRNGGKKPLVIINGKVLSDDQEIKEALEKYDAKGKGLGLSSDEEIEQIIINGQDMMKIRSEALADADIQIKRMRPQMEKQMEIVRKEKNRVKAEMDKARAEMEASKPEMEKAKAEMIQAKEEMLKAKAEMVKAKTELDNERAKLKKAK
jgi:multidrug resistance efflux pump